MTVREVLILRALGLGDFLTGVPAYRGLRRAFPDAHLTLAAPGVLAPLVPLVGAIDRLLPTEGLGRLAYEGRRPYLAVNLHGAGPESIDELRSARPRRLLTHAHPLRPDVPGPGWLEDQHEVARWCRLLASAGVVAVPTDLRLDEPEEAAAIPDAVVIHPGASAPARRWPARRYAMVARGLHAEGHHVVITGGPSESRLASQVLHAAGLPGDRLLLDLDLADLAALVSRARLVVCGDTGVAHLATAYGTRSVILFGPTSPAHWGPPPSGAHAVLWTGQVGDPHGSRPEPGLLAIGVDAVLMAARDRLTGPGQRLTELAVRR